MQALSIDNSRKVVKRFRGFQLHHKEAVEETPIGGNEIIVTCRVCSLLETLPSLDIRIPYFPDRFSCQELFKDFIQGLILRISEPETCMVSTNQFLKYIHNRKERN